MTLDARRRRAARRRRHARAAALAVLLVVLFPVLWLLQMSFRAPDDIFAEGLAFSPTLQNYRDLWSGLFPRSFVNSLVVSSASTGLALLVGVPAAYVLARWRFRLRRTVAMWILLTRMVPPIAFTIPFFLAYRWTGLLDTKAGLVLVYMTFNLTLVIWMMQTFFAGLPPQLEEAASVDGCTVWGAFLRIVLPLTGPGVAATAVLCFIYSWNDFFYALVLTRTDAMTAPVAIVNFLQYEGWEWGKIAAGGVMVMLPVVVFTLLVRNYLVSGLTAGGLKD